MTQPTNPRTTYIPPSRLDSLEADGFDYRDVHGLHKGFVTIAIIFLAATVAVYGTIGVAVVQWVTS